MRTPKLALTRMFTALLPAVLATVTLTGDARAVDGKNLPGVACVAEDGADQADMQYTQGSIANTGHTTGAAVRNVRCPILRDNGGASLGMGDFDAYVDDSTTLDNVSCTVYVRSASGSGQLCSDTQATTNNQADDNIHLDWGADTLYGINCDEASAFFYMVCSLPDESKVWNYLWEED